MRQEREREREREGEGERGGEGRREGRRGGVEVGVGGRRLGRGMVDWGGRGFGFFGLGVRP